MEINVTVPSTEDSIFYINQLCKTTFQHYRVKDHHTYCFLIHEVVINAIEATKRKYAEMSKSKTLIFHLQLTDSLVVKMLDEVGGLSQEYLDSLNPERLQDILLWSESGRGLLLIKEAAEEVWYKEISGRFELGFKKGVTYND